VNLFNAGNAIIGDGRGVRTILDNDLKWRTGYWRRRRGLRHRC